jgi:hypothetical protein
MVGAAEAIRGKKNRESAELKSSQITGRSNQVSALTVHENPQIYDASQWSIHLTLVFHRPRTGPSFALLFGLARCDVLPEKHSGRVPRGKATDQ